MKRECYNCQYPLDAMQTRCPECGTWAVKRPKDDAAPWWFLLAPMLTFVQGLWAARSVRISDWVFMSNGERTETVLYIVFALAMGATSIVCFASRWMHWQTRSQRSANAYRHSGVVCVALLLIWYGAIGWL